MDLKPLKLPPGMMKNGTEYQQQNRWVGGNLIRWQDRVVQNIGGWASRFVVPVEGVIDAEHITEVIEDIIDGGGAEEPMTPLDVVDAGGAADFALIPIIEDLTDECVRDAFAWRSNSQDQHMVWGSNRRLLHISQLDAVTDITPVGAVESGKDPSTVAGYGRNPYGFGAYGVGNDLVAQDPLPPQRWGFATFGEVLLFVQRGVGPVYELDLFDLSVSDTAGAPLDVVDLTVTDQRFVMTVGGAAGPRAVQWSDQEDRTEWTPAVSNQAGSQTLSGVGRLLRCIPILGQTLILGESDAYIATYLGAPFVFGFNLIGNNCGPLCPEAVLATERLVVWWGKSAFWLFDGALKPINCEVMEFLENDVDQSMVTKTSCMSINQHNEVWWLYQSRDSTTNEIDSYVIWNYKEQTWNCGRLDRSAGIDAGVVRYPIMISPNAILYTHEQEGIIPQGSVFALTGPLEMNMGSSLLAIRAIFPDTEAFGQCRVTAFARELPTGREITFGPYLYNNPTPTRIIGRQIRLRYDRATTASNFRIGDMRIDVSPVQSGR